MTNFMGALKERRGELLLLILLSLALVFLFLTIKQYPLVDSDEATYAQITKNMAQSGDVWTLKLLGSNWFGKPPLYFWLATVSVNIFGTEEFAFRLPSVLTTLITLWIVFLLVRRLSGSATAATVAFLILLFSPEYYAFGREARLDSGVVMSIVLALYFVVAGWTNGKFLFGVSPAIVVGIMFKSLIAGLAIPVIVIFCLVYWRWAWLRNKYFWLGVVPAVLIAAPWHVVESAKFGWDFWRVYFYDTVLQRSVSRVAGTSDAYIYLKILWQYYIPWVYATILLAGSVLTVKIWKRSDYRINRGVTASFACVAFILILFSVLETRLSTYILPAFPFLAIFLALALFDIAYAIKLSEIIGVIFILPLLATGAFFCIKTVDALVAPMTYEEKAVGIALQRIDQSTTPVYVFDWPYLETVTYYSNRATPLVSVKNPKTVFKAPFYLITNTNAISYFYNREGKLMSGYESLRLLYAGRYLVLTYSDQDLTLPDFGLKPQ